MNIAMRCVLIFGILAFLVTIFKNISPSMILNLDALLIVVGGTTIALFVGFPLSRIRSTWRDLLRAYTEQNDRETVVKDILDIARMHMRTSVRKLEDRMHVMENDFLKLGVKLLINDYQKADIKNILEREMVDRTIHHNFSQNLLRTAARLTPSLGLAGTVISLIKMFNQLDSVDALAPLMAVALMSTFYGVILANLVMLPLCAKLREWSIESEAIMHIVMEGLLAVKSGEHPLKVEERIRGTQQTATASSLDGSRTMTIPHVSSATT